MLRLLAAALATLLVACGGRPTPDGGSGGGGGSGAGGGGKLGDDDAGLPAPIHGGFGGCETLNPCAASLVGTWHHTDGCIAGYLAEVQAVCAAIVVSNPYGDIAGRLDVDSTYLRLRYQGSLTGDLTVPPSCLSGSMTCADIQTSLRTYHAGTNCSAADAGCSCKVVNTIAIDNYSTYSVSGSRFTAAGLSYDFCVDGGTLKFVSAAGASGGFGIREFQKQ
jgi:hypothetical protein